MKKRMEYDCTGVAVTLLLVEIKKKQTKKKSAHTRLADVVNNPLLSKFIHILLVKLPWSQGKKAQLACPLAFHLFVDFVFPGDGGWKVGRSAAPTTT